MATPVQMPKQGNTVEECLLVEWKCEEGERVREGDALCTIETDKATFDIPSPASGVLLRRFFPAGELVPVLVNIAAVGEEGEDVAALEPASGEGEGRAQDEAGDVSATVPAAPAPHPGGAPAPAGASGVSPRARNLSRRLGVDPTLVAGSGPGGRVVSRDVQQAVDRGLARTRAAAAAGMRPAGSTGLGGRARLDDLRPVAAGAASDLDAPPEEIPFKGIRKLIGERMLQSLAGHAQLTLNSSADATNLLAFRRRVKERGPDLGLPNITLNDLVAFVTARTLAGFPQLNATFQPGGGSLLRYRQVHLGIAVDSERGLMVPVVRDAHALSLAELSGRIAELAGACRRGNVNPDLLQGGTFTITNLGAMGVESFTPVLNTPQVAILGVCSIIRTPVPAPGGGVAFQPRMGLSLTIDHQVVDGAPAARFLQALAANLAGFDLLLAA